MIAKGIKGLLASKKGTLSLIILACSTVGLMLGKLDGTSYAAIVATVSAIYQYTCHKTDIAAMNQAKDLSQ